MNIWGTIPDWILVVAAIGTFVFSFIIWLNSRKLEKHKFWNGNLPVLNIASPCGDCLPYCSDNIIDPEIDKTDNGNALLEISNITENPAFDITIEISKSEDFNTIDRGIFYNHIRGDGAQYIFSKYHVDPSTKEPSYSHYDISKILEDCESDTRDSCKKNLYLRCSYYSSPSHDIAVKSESIFKVKIQCINCKTEGKKVTIVSIVRDSYSNSKI